MEEVEVNLSKAELTLLCELGIFIPTSETQYAITPKGREFLTNYLAELEAKNHEQLIP